MTHMPGTNGFGHHFVLTPFMDRSSGYVFRILAVRNDTNVTISYGTTVMTVPLSEFEFHEGDISTVNTVTTISTTNEVFVTQFAKGFSSDSKTGDPFMLLVPPSNFYSNNVTFPVTSIPIFFGTEQKSYINVVIRCDEVPGITVDGKDEPYWTKYTDPLDGEELCVLRKEMAHGLHSVEHSSREAKFAVLVYGFGLSASYAYFAGYNFKEVDTSIPGKQRNIF